MDRSILLSIKKLLGLGEDYDCFDLDVMMHINSALSILQQIGVGPKEGFFIHDASATWEDFLGEDSGRLESVITYVYIKVKLIFDPPTSSSAVDSMERTASEYEWRLNSATDY